MNAAINAHDSPLQPQKTMTDQHRATPEQWALLEGSKFVAYYSCILELRDRVKELEQLHTAVVEFSQRLNLDQLVTRVEALEAAQRPQEDKSNRPIAQDCNDPPSSASLLERVMQRMIEWDNSGGSWMQGASSVILGVASWLAENADQAREDLTNEEAAQWLRDEVARLRK